MIILSAKDTHYNRNLHLLAAKATGWFKLKKQVLKVQMVSRKQKFHSIF